MGILDIIVLFLGIAAGISSYMTGSDALYKLFLGLLIGFLAYLLVESQVEVTTYLSPAEANGYERFLAEHATGILTFMLLMVPFLGIFFMMNTRLSYATQSRNPSHILLGLLLPVFLIGILAYLSQGSLLATSPVWQKIFGVFENSSIFQAFQKLPWVIFLMLLFLIFYKSIFLLASSFGEWLYKDVIKQYFTSWDTRKNHENRCEVDDES